MTTKHRAFQAGGAALVRAGPHGIGNRRRSSAGTSDHGRYARIPGHKAFEPRTSAAEAARLRTPPDGCRRLAALAKEAGGQPGTSLAIARAGAMTRPSLQRWPRRRKRASDTAEGEFMSVLAVFRWEGDPDALLAAYDRELQHAVPVSNRVE